MPTPKPQSDLRKATPNYNELLASLTGNFLSNLSGQLPMDVQNQIMDAANARAYAGGYGGSGLGRNLTLRDLGLNSLQRQDVGANQLMQFLPIQSRTTTVDPALQSQINEFNSIAASRPDPTAYATFKLQREDQIRNQNGTTSPPAFGGAGGIPSGGMPGFGFSSSLSNPIPNFQQSFGSGGYAPISGNFSGTGGTNSPWANSTPWSAPSTPSFDGQTLIGEYSGAPTYTDYTGFGPASFNSITNTPAPPSTFGGFDSGFNGSMSSVDQILADFGIA